jgi:hypothetical protein
VRPLPIPIILQEDAMSEKITVALIEHGIRPVVYLLLGLAFVFWLFSVKEPLFQVLKSSETHFKAGSFEVSLRAMANAGHLADELTALQTLNDAQLQLFLVMTKWRRPIGYHGEEVNEENLRKLKELGLLLDYRKDDKGEFHWEVSEKAHRLNDIIFSQVVKSIKRTPTA